jgi:hypothetical protein
MGRAKVNDGIIFLGTISVDQYSMIRYHYVMVLTVLCLAGFVMILIRAILRKIFDAYCLVLPSNGQWAAKLNLDVSQVC